MKLLNLAVYVFLTLWVPIKDCLFCIFFLVSFIISLLKLYLRNGKITASARDEIVFLNISKISSVFLCFADRASQYIYLSN